MRIYVHILLGLLLPTLIAGGCNESLRALHVVPRAHAAAPASGIGNPIISAGTDVIDGKSSKGGPEPRCS